MLHAVDNKLKYTFRKQDRLKSSLDIEALYRANQFVVSYPLKCYFLFSELTENQNSICVAFTVPKKTFKNAIHRNSLKRRMREAYRLNYKKILEQFINQQEKQLQLLIIFIGNEIVNYTNIVQNMVKLLQKIDSFKK